MAAEAPRTRIRALRTLDVDNVRIEEGEIAEIRSALVPELLRIGACEDELDETAEMPGQTEGEGPLAPVDPSAVSAAAPAAAPEAEPIKEAEEGPVSSEGQAATPGDAAAVADEAAVDGKAGEAAGASNPAARAPRRPGKAKA